MRTPMRRAVSGLSAAAALWILPGCDGGSAPSVDGSATEATVKGVVKINGAPATEGEIVFNPANPKRPNAPQHSVTIGKDGTYTVTTLTGPNSVRLGGAVVKKNPIVGREQHEFIVKAGENTYDFESNAKK